MANTPATLGNYTPQSVALQLAALVLELEGKRISGGTHADYPKEYASRKELLDTYVECLDAVTQRRVVKREQP